MESNRPSQPTTPRVGMDGVLRRGGAAPVDMRAPRPTQPQPVQRPVAQTPRPVAPQPQMRPQPMPQQRPVARPEASVQQPEPTPEPKRKAPRTPRAPRTRNGNRGLKIFFQTLLALVVILGVAVAIVVLYLRYYQ